MTTLPVDWCERKLSRFRNWLSLSGWLKTWKIYIQTSHLDSLWQGQIILFSNFFTIMSAVVHYCFFGFHLVYVIKPKKLQNFYWKFFFFIVHVYIKIYLFNLMNYLWKISFSLLIPKWLLSKDKKALWDSLGLL